MKFDAAKLLNDKRVLYVVLFLAITNLVGYLIARNYNAVLFFLLACIVVRFFNKNNTIILASALIATTLVLGGNMVKENFNAMGKKKSADVKKKIKNKTTKTSDMGSSNRAKIKSGMANINEDDTDTDTEDGDKSLDNQEKIASGKKSQLDYAGTVESAYDNLDKLLSSDALKNMGLDTKKFEKDLQSKPQLKQQLSASQRCSPETEQRDCGSCVPNRVFSV